ncbi:MAG TPA: right-handed parallel beta-helix repeat-containing protein [Planctomycetota bacterium]|nr:right-handed parallel beta-helix repeat-containing protein [Planctomycetota bacterium]
MQRTRFHFAAPLGLMLAASPLFAGTLYVDANLTTGANDGSTWANAYQGSSGLQAALAAAVSGDQIFAAQGTYFASATNSRTQSFAMRNGVEIYGGFAGGESAVYQRPPIGTAPSILSGDLAGNDGSGIRTDNSYHLITTTSTNATAVIDGFTVTGGNANAGSNNDRGGGILILGSVQPTIRNCTFVDNRCTFGGGAGYINGAAPTFTDCTFDSNLGGSYGGAFDIAGAGAVKFDRCRFVNNSAARAGALEIFSTSGARVTNSLFANNTATGASGGGGMWVGSGGNSQIRNCTFVSNNSPAQAAGAGLRSQGASVTVSNAIFWNNTGPGGTQTSTNQVNGATVTYSIVQGGLAGLGNLSADPLFVDAPGGNYELLPLSPATDAGDNTLVPTELFLDIRHKHRFEDNANVADTGFGMAPITDMGAYEFTTGLGAYYCESGANSTGYKARIHVAGSLTASDNDLTLSGETLPPNQFLIFLNGTAPGLVPNPGGSSGDLCLGGAIGRFNALSQILNTGAGGTASLTIDLLGLPTPTGPAAVSAGETWYFQAWFRDNVIGFPTSNFTDAVAVSFE